MSNLKPETGKDSVIRPFAREMEFLRGTRITKAIKYGGEIIRLKSAGSKSRQSVNSWPDKFEPRSSVLDEPFAVDLSGIKDSYRGNERNLAQVGQRLQDLCMLDQIK